ncbi:MAG: RNA polymerase factor sigma-54 [Desulfitobacteriaceae bacterium]|nr:RNA polymerase factor sigma-54 [Desulfitobacteriaceae bacterium]
MRLSYRLSLEQTQRLIMTPELRQAITILQLSALELTTYVDQQMLENPLLEVTEETLLGKEEAEIPPVPDESYPEQKWEFDWQEYFQDRDERPFLRQEHSDYVMKQQSEPFITSAPTLQEHLLEQLHVQPLKLALSLCEYIVGNLDDNGYLTISIEDIAKDQAVTVDKADEALKLIQELDPLGVGARSLEECLRLQLPLIQDCPAEMDQFLGQLENLAAGRLQKIAQTLKVSTSRIQELADLVRNNLDPKPGRGFSGPDEIRLIIPDVVVEEIEGEYIILVNDTIVPRLGINDAYRKALSQEQGTETRKFVEQKLNSAAWLIRSIEQRRMTLYKVTKEIVRQQTAFLRYGISFLKPLTLRNIAEQVGVHESTVSRATSNKYIQTPRGVFQLKFFFANGLGKEQGVTTESIKQVVREIITCEDPKNPYSDQKISVILEERGIKISRRTVAKYRDEMRIPTTTVRKRY